MPSQSTSSPNRGLAGVKAGQTAICSLSGTLRYRGYSIDELINGSFEEVAFLLLEGELPTAGELSSFTQRLQEAARNLPSPVIKTLKDLAVAAPHASVMDVLRTGVSLLGQLGCDNGPKQPINSIEIESQKKQAIQLIGQVAAVLATWIELTSGREPTPWPDRPFPAALLERLCGEAPSPAAEKVFDTTLILYAEHEFNASTFAARTVASTGADMHSATTAAIGTLKGPLHGGANEKVLEQLGEIGTLERVEPWLADQFIARRVVMGFGHRVYKQGDVRARLLAEACRTLVRDKGMPATHRSLENLADHVEALMDKKKGLKPNLDWPAARVYHALGLPAKVFTPIFVVARMSGWTAHIIEQMQNNRLIRPLSEYCGHEPRAYVPPDQRASPANKTGKVNGSVGTS